MVIGCLGVELRGERFLALSHFLSLLIVLAVVLALAPTPNSSSDSTMFARLKDLCITAATVGAGVAMLPSPQQCLRTVPSANRLVPGYLWRAENG
jgi:hypothetical protein